MRENIFSTFKILGALVTQISVKLQKIVGKIQNLEFFQTWPWETFTPMSWVQANCQEVMLKSKKVLTVLFTASASISTLTC
jgi:hypothetical protein